MIAQSIERVTVQADITPILTLAEAKAHLRVAHLVEDDLIAGYIAAAMDHLDGYGGVLGRALTLQQWRATFSDFPCDGQSSIDLPIAPFVAVDEIVYDDLDGEAVTLDPAAYRARKDMGLGRLYPARGASWPSDAAELRIAYTVGYAPENPAPAAIKHAALLIVGDLYDNRSAQTEGKIVSVNATVERLIAPLRVRSW